jgi:hypothetical protein
MTYRDEYWWESIPAAMILVGIIAFAIYTFTSNSYEEVTVKATVLQHNILHDKVRNYHTLLRTEDGEILDSHDLSIYVAPVGKQVWIKTTRDKKK